MIWYASNNVISSSCFQNQRLKLAPKMKMRFNYFPLRNFSKINQYISFFIFLFHSLEHLNLGNICSNYITHSFWGWLWEKFSLLTSYLNRTFSNLTRGFLRFNELTTPIICSQLLQDTVSSVLVCTLQYSSPTMNCLTLMPYVFSIFMWLMWVEYAT